MRDGKGKRSGRLLRPAESLQNSVGFSRKTHTLWKGALCATNGAVGKNAGVSFAKKERSQIISPNHEIVIWVKVKVGESLFCQAEKSLSGIRTKKQEWMSERKNSSRGPGNSWFYFKSGQI